MLILVAYSVLSVSRLQCSHVGGPYMIVHVPQEPGKGLPHKKRISEQNFTKTSTSHQSSFLPPWTITLDETNRANVVPDSVHLYCSLIWLSSYLLQPAYQTFWGDVPPAKSSNHKRGERNKLKIVSMQKDRIFEQHKMLPLRRKCVTKATSTTLFPWFKPKKLTIASVIKNYPRSNTQILITRE